MRVVVCVLGGDGGPWELPASSFVERPWIYGGERTMYELAVAAAALGHEVELRGGLVRGILDEIAEAGGARPRVDAEARRPTAGDFVVLPEGVAALPLARVALSPARSAVLLLAPPGLFGPGLEEGFEQQDPLTVDRDSLALPRHFQALASLGFELWTNTRGLAEASISAGIPCSFLGTGQPIAFPDPGPRTHDVTMIEANRWAPLARQVVAELDGACLVISEGDRESVIRGLAASRILVLPARIEGQLRIQLEARAVGTVPVALRSNRFAVTSGMDDAGGAVLVDSIEEMPAAIKRLLASDGELRELSDRAMRTAREQMDWTGFVGRVAEVLARPAPEDNGRSARAGVGAAIEGVIEDLHTEIHLAGQELGRVGQELGRAGEERWDLAVGLGRSEEERTAMADEIAWLRGVARRSEEDREAAARELRALRARRSVRLALRLADTIRLRKRT